MYFFKLTFTLHFKPLITTYILTFQLTKTAHFLFEIVLLFFRYRGSERITFKIHLREEIKTHSGFRIILNDLIF